MTFESTPCPLPAKFSSVTPLYDRSLLSAASHNAVPLLLPVFNLGLSSQIELPTVNIYSPVRQGKKSSKYLNTNTILASSHSSSSLKAFFCTTANNSSVRGLYRLEFQLSTPVELGPVQEMYLPSLFTLGSTSASGAQKIIVSPSAKESMN